ncbi:hypothetical protein NPIL_248451 [Nephila pilipes]|uniref:Uncharacterized protein n=1 Tax=Nephila pilipes TaxID=299642 RepID=A0A8X6QKY6_NEPPI|nr:hypothetical protein NPIL_248451 [Nephila pilipes]
MRQNVKFFPLVFNERWHRDPIGMFYLGLHNYWFCLGLALFLSVLSQKSHAVDPFSQKLEVFGRRSDPRTESTFFLKSVSQPCLLLHAYLSQILDGVARRADNTGCTLLNIFLSERVGCEYAKKTQGSYKSVREINSQSFLREWDV